MVESLSKTLFVERIMYMEAEDHLHSVLTLQENTTRVVLHMLINVISKIKNLEEITSEYLDVFLSSHMLCKKICSRLSMCEMYLLAKLSSKTELNLQKYLKERFERCMCSSKNVNKDFTFFQLVDMDPIPLLVADLKALEMEASARIAAHASHFMSFLAKIIADILAKQHGQEKRTAFMEALNNYHDVEHPMTLQNTPWNECSKNMSLICRGSHRYLPLYYNEQFLIAKKVDDSLSCTECPTGVYEKKEPKLNKKNNTFLQIALCNILGLEERFLYETLNTGCFQDRNRLPRECCFPIPAKFLDHVPLLSEENKRVSNDICQLKEKAMDALHHEGLIVFEYRALNNEGVVRDAMASDFLDRNAFLYIFMNKAIEIENFLIELEREFQIKRLCRFAYKKCIIPLTTYMIFFPKEIIKDRKTICIFFLEFDDYCRCL